MPTKKELEARVTELERENEQLVELGDALARKLGMPTKEARYRAALEEILTIPRGNFAAWDVVVRALKG